MSQKSSHRRDGDAATRREAALAEAGVRTCGLKTCESYKSERKPHKQIHQLTAEAFNMTFQIIDQMQVTG